MKKGQPIRRGQRSVEFIDEPVDALKIRLEELKMINDFIINYNKMVALGKTSNTETVHGFIVNRIDDVNYSLSKKATL